jgi:hypothetical protein
MESTAKPTLLVEEHELAVDDKVLKRRARLFKKRLNVRTRESKKVVTLFRKQQKRRCYRDERDDPDPYSPRYIFYVPHGWRRMTPEQVRKFWKDAF